jgi:CubicO group peptidase (beta-lactamase class C family)
MKKFTNLVIFIFVFVSLFTGCKTKGGDEYTEPIIQGSWPYYSSPGEAGWDADRLEAAKSYFSSLNSAAVIVVYRGKVLVAWGYVYEKYLTHSARKSFMSALYGIYVHEGQIDLQETMAQLNIDDVPPLTELEKSARVIHLLAARSGVYHTAAAETESMHQYKPPRGTYLPGTFWCYNNWDFNALGTIFIQETGMDIFQALKQRIADEIGMEDFIIDDGFYYYQYDRSIHPAYHFQMSARDSARFGLLFLQNGRWEGRQIIPTEWIEESTRPWSDSGDYIPGTFYGYLWWVFPLGYGEEDGLLYLSQYQSYAALGAYGQVIQVIPDADLVFVHRVDSYNNMNVNLGDIYRLLDMILAAKP